VHPRDYFCCTSAEVPGGPKALACGSWALPDLTYKDFVARFSYRSGLRGAKIAVTLSPA
jgi:hypothetical protein